MSTYYQSTSKRCLYAAFSVFLIILFYSQVESQIFSDDQLLNYGIQSYDQMNYSKAALYLFAYIQRQPDAMTQDQDFAQSVQKAYSYSQMKLDTQLQSVPSSQSQPQPGIGRTTQGLEVPPPELKKPEKMQMLSYKLVLRGGGNIYFQYVPYSNFSRSPQVWITFGRALVATGQNLENRYELQPGQAAWLDRPISTNEPNRLLLKERIGEFTISWYNGQVSGVSSALPYLTALQDPNRFVTFHVYNDGKGNFIVTHVDQ
jgi:hypothetical protein